jgi:hypothetical protein
LKKYLIPIVFLVSLLFRVNGQTMPFGAIDTADLKMTSCDFEKDANAEILFDKGRISLESGLSMDRHVRIKIFNDFGKRNADVRLVYHTAFLGGKGYSGLQAETINLKDNKIVITPLDKAQVFTEKIDKNFSAIVFTLPNVQAGSVIEYKFSCYPQNNWFFQNSLPTRYSEIQVHFRKYYVYKTLQAETFVRQPFVVDTRDSHGDDQLLALANIHSLPVEPYMTARANNLQRVEFNYSDFSWSTIAAALVIDKEFGRGLDETLPGEDGIIRSCDSLGTYQEKIAFIFDTVKNSMKWNNKTFFLTSDGIKTAWTKKSGNSGEINLIVYHFLKACKIDAYPMIVCTREYGRISPIKADPFSFNNAVTYVPIDTANFYVLDASSKYGLYNTTPYSILDSYGVCIYPATKKCKFILLENKSPVIQSVFLNAEITDKGKMTGTSEIMSDSYNRVEVVKNYQTMGEKKYVDSLLQKGNNTTISSINFENINNDFQPLTQKIAFNIDLTSSDENYIYFNTNLFTLMEDNPFKSEQRFSDIDLGYRNNYSVSGIYKIPAGYKVDALPKPITIIMPDQSIVFKRMVAQDNGTVLVRYSISHKKTIYFMEEYQDIRGFYKKMYDLLNEQVVLKKQ